jgi:hypothetical protein
MLLRFEPARRTTIIVDPAMLALWTVLGILVGWLTGQYLFGYRLIDDVIGGLFGSIIGGAVAHSLFGEALGGSLGSAVFGVALAISLVLALRVLPGHHFT